MRSAEHAISNNFTVVCLMQPSLHSAHGRKQNIHRKTSTHHNRRSSQYMLKTCVSGHYGGKSQGVAQLLREWHIITINMKYKGRIITGIVHRLTFSWMGQCWDNLLCVQSAICFSCLDISTPDDTPQQRHYCRRDTQQVLPGILTLSRPDPQRSTVMTSTWYSQRSHYVRDIYTLSRTILRSREQRLDRRPEVRQSLVGFTYKLARGSTFKVPSWYTFKGGIH